MKPRDHGMERIGDVLEDMRRTGRLDKGIKVQSLGDVWPAVESLWSERTIGKYVAQNSHPVEFKNGTLTIICANPSIMQVLSEQKTSIIERLNTQMGGQLVRNLSFGLENVHEVHIQRPPAATQIPAPDPDSLAKTIPLSPELTVRAEESVRSIHDPSLRLAFLRAYEAWLRWGIWRREEQQKRRSGRPSRKKY